LGREGGRGFDYLQVWQREERKRGSFPWKATICGKEGMANFAIFGWLKG
jgi:hypothetical protein